METYEKRLNKKTQKAIEKFIDDIMEIEDYKNEPMNGDETLELSGKVLKALDHKMGNR